MNFKLSSDPEVFLSNSAGELVSSIGIIPGSKFCPSPLVNGAYQPDNVSLEFNPIPSNTRKQFIANHVAIMDEISSILKPLDLKMDIVSSILATPLMLDNPLARQAGCMPDMNAYSQSFNPPPKLRGALRAAGGHLHCSFDRASMNNDRDVRFNFVRGCDLLLGIPSVILDTDKRRRTLYGKAGACRPKFTSDFDEYDGIEYRTLSNFWLKSESLMGWVFDRVTQVLNNIDELSKISKEHEEEIVDIINTGSVTRARVFMKTYGEIYE